MMGDMEYMWQAMKTSHYQRIMDQLAKTIHDTKDFQKAVSAALGTVIKAMHAQTGTMWLYDRFGTGRIHPKAVYSGADLSGTSLAPGEGIAGQVVETGTGVIIEDCQKDPRWASRVDSKTGFRTKTMICVPLSWVGHTFGCIQIINSRKDMLFDEKDLAFAQRLAEEVAALLKKEGMLREYVPDVPQTEPEVRHEDKGPSFYSVFCQGTDRDMEKELQKVDAFAALSLREKKEVFYYCKQIRAQLRKHSR